ncbi:tyrosine recombinase, partial [Moniliophthora roreri MCA 2997]
MKAEKDQQAKWSSRICAFSQAVIQNGIESSIATTYAAGLWCFHKFCDLMSVDEDLRMPADKTLMTAFVRFFLGSKNRGTIKTWLLGLWQWHILNDTLWEEYDWLKLTHTSANKAGSHHKRDPRPPLTRQHLAVLKCRLDLTKHQDAAIYACAASTTYGCCHLGKTTVPSKSKFNSKRHITQ